MLAKITSKNQLTLPKAVTQAVGPAEYFDVEARNGQIILTPVRIQRADLVRAKLAELELSEADLQDAVAWSRSVGASPLTVSQPVAEYKVERAGPASSSKKPNKSASSKKEAGGPAKRARKA